MEAIREGLEALRVAASDGMDTRELRVNLDYLRRREIMQGYRVDPMLEYDVVSLPEMVSRRFLINFLLLWADQNVA